MVRILSLELDLDKEIRVTKVKRYIENDQPTYRYELTLSDFLDTNGFKELVKEVEDMPDEIRGEFDPKTTDVQTLGLYMAGAKRND